jgi:DUF4097 and DUF4098 domain-containing protein YvlB
MTRYSVIALVLLAASSVNAAEKTLDRTFTVSPGGTLVVDSDSASVHVSGKDTNQVTVRMTARGSDESLSGTTLDAVQNADGVTVTMRRQPKSSWFNWRSWNTEQHIEVTVPQRYGISVRTGGGSVKLRDTIGSATLRTSGGSIAVNDVNGNLELRTSGGGIHAETIRGDVDASTSGGDVRLLQIDGRIKGHTSGGSVRCSLVGSNRGISLTTSGGAIELTLPRAATGNVEATTSGGGITSDLPVTASVLKDDRLRGSLNGGGQPIEARTSGGSIRLRVAD